MRKTDGFIDIHAHILPGVDDGSDSMDETLRMLQTAYEQGIRTMIATPHYMPGGDNIPKENLSVIRDQVQVKIDEIGLNLKLLLGNEIYYSGSIVGLLKSKKALTLADSRYVLVEFSPKEAYDTMYNKLGELVHFGFWPVLAHVERYRCFYKNDFRISDLIEMGCCIQMNASSVLGGILDTEAIYNRRLIKQGLVHFIGSDCHDDRNRIPCMKMAEKTLQKRCDERLLNRLFYENPFKVLENTYI
jgi:protein-tyrosine phosphatase